MIRWWMEGGLSREEATARIDAVDAGADTEQGDSSFLIEVSGCTAPRRTPPPPPSGTSASSAGRIVPAPPPSPAPPPRPPKTPPPPSTNPHQPNQHDPTSPTTNTSDVETTHGKILDWLSTIVFAAVIICCFVVNALTDGCLFDMLSCLWSLLGGKGDSG